MVEFKFVNPAASLPCAVLPVSIELPLDDLPLALDPTESELVAIILLVSLNPVAIDPCDPLPVII